MNGEQKGDIRTSNGKARGLVAKCNMTITGKPGWPEWL